VKDSTIQLRISKENKARIKKAADYLKMSVSRYIITLIVFSLEDLEDVIQNKTQIDIEKL